MNRKFLSIVVLVFLGCSCLLAQENDYGLWTSISVGKDLKKWNLSSTAELRTTNYLSDVNRWSIDVDASYKIFKPLRLGASYKFIYFHDFKYSDFQPRNRFSLYLLGKQKLDRLTISLRERAELTYKDESDRIKSNGTINTYTINPDLYWRNKLKIAYDIPKIPLTPAFSVESFYQLNNPDGNVFDELRYVISLSYKLSKHHSIDAYGLLGKEINVSSPATKYVVGLEYCISL